MPKSCTHLLMNVQEVKVVLQLVSGTKAEDPTYTPPPWVPLEVVAGGTRHVGQKRWDKADRKQQKGWGRRDRAGMLDQVNRVGQRE